MTVGGSRQETSTVRIGLVYPELLGTYGDRGNATVLANRCFWRGIDAEIVEISAASSIPDSLDIYLFGGGEDNPQTLAAAGMMRSNAALTRAIARGASVLAVCAGFQLLGDQYIDAEGSTLDGLGIVSMSTTATSPRLIGEVVIEPDLSLGLPTLTGFENHGGRTTLGADVQALGHVLVGGGNGEGTVDGAVVGHVIGTYLHGPVLARNPALADRLLTWVVGDLDPLASPLEEQLRTERLDAALAKGFRRWRQRRHIARG